MTEPESTTRRRSGRARSAWALLAWLAAVAGATLAGMVAVGAIGSGIISGGERPLGEAEVSRLLAQPTPSTGPTGPAAPTAPTAPAASATSGPGTSALPSAAPGATKVIGSAGGSVIARCAPGIEVVSATPAQGYRVKDVEPEDGGLRVRFESGGTRVELTLTCAAGQPTADVRIQS
jgi:hypothetical protein